MSFKEYIPYIPQKLLKELGAVFYSGQSAFSGHIDLYIIGHNSGGKPMEGDTIEKHLRNMEKRNGEIGWSEYTDEKWGSCDEQGEHWVQKRIQHVFENLGLDLCSVPAK